MSMPVSLKHIAEEAGVSRTTASLALRNHPRISAETRRRVQEIAERLGYHPNPEVSKVMGLIRESKPCVDRPVLGLLTDMPEPLSHARPPSETWRGFEERAVALGYRPEEFWVGKRGITPERLRNILLTRGIRGLVISALRDPAFLAALDVSGFSVSLIGHSIHTPALHRAFSDKYGNTLLSCEQLWQRGCRRIGLAVPRQQEDRVEHLFLSGYLVFHHLHAHAGWKTPLVEEGAWEPARIAAWARSKRVDALIVAYPGLEARLPDIPLAQVNCMDGRGPGIRQRHDRIAAAAVDLADAQLRRNETGIPAYAKTLLVAGEWVDH